MWAAHDGFVAKLTERRLLDEAGEAVYGRGEDYVRYVVGLRVDGNRAKATIQAKNVYLAELDWAQRELRSSCTCPHFDQGFFCKHVVAVGLAAIDVSRSGVDIEPDADSVAARLVGALENDELRAVLTDLASRDPGVRRALELRVAVRHGDQPPAIAELDSLVKNALAVRGFIDYRRSFSVARDAQEMLDELEQHLDAGAADVVRPALLRVVTRLRKIVLQADDSSGSIGDASQRAGELYARSCREGSPDARKVASWLVKFRESSPGWPQLELADFVEAFDGPALATYRRAVAKLDAQQRDRDHVHRFEVDAMLLELADHDGDVDRAVDLLSEREHPEYGSIVNRLREAGRADAAVAWIDRGVAAGRVSGQMGGNEFWLDVLDVAATYRDLGRADDGLAVLQSEFVSRPGAPTFQALLRYADVDGRADEQRAWALAQARKVAGQPYYKAATLVEIALAEGDLDAAWSAAREFGAGHQWKALAAASADYAPLEAAALHRVQLEQDLKFADTSRYAGIADRLVIMRDLHRRGDAEPDIAAYLAELRETYQRRTSLMRELDRRGL